MLNLAIIPARGGSKRIPKKNIKLFLGKPIIAYSIERAIESNLFDDIIVSTDDIEIAKIAKDYGAKVPYFRSEINSSDFATTFDVIEEVINEQHIRNQDYENVCCIYPCAPLISKELIINAFEVMKLNNFDTVFPVVKYGNQIQRALRLNDNRIEMFYPQFKTTRSQDLEIAFYDAGQFYWSQINQLLRYRQLFSSNSGFIILDEIHAQDIDNEIDWDLAEIKYSLLKLKKHV
jgi:pseudaminic acid cytidylyltransferase